MQEKQSLDAHIIFDRDLLVRRRNRASADAARFEFLLDRATEDICDRLSIVQRRFDTAAVIGAHHGMLGRRVRGLSNVGRVIETESAAGMLAQCDGPRVLTDEELLPFRDGSLDLAVSALALQFVNDLPGALAQIRRALKPDGLFLAAMIGGRTLVELREAFLVAEAEVEGGASPRVAPFVDVRDAGALLQRAGFALPVADADTIDVTYSTPLDLMRDVKGMGAANMLMARRRAPLRRATLLRAMEVYVERFGTGDGRVGATFEIITLTGWAPHESQQKPLKPGSARSRLADALRVPERPAGEKPGS